MAAELIPSRLSVIAKTADGLSHAFVRLDLKETKISELNGLEKYPHLRYIDASYNQLTNAGVAPLNALKYLLTLDLQHNKLTSILSEVESRAYLQVLNLSHNEIESLGEVSHKALTALSLNFNKIASLTGFGGVSEVKNLELRGNKLTSTAGIAAVANVIDLVLSGNEIASLEEINELKKLHTLYLRGNKLTSLSGIENSPSLNYINLRENQIEQLSEIAKLATLPYLRKLNLQGNPIAEQDNYRVEVALLLPKLEVLDKEPITQEEKEAAEDLKEERKREAEEAAAALAAEEAARLAEEAEADEE